MDTTAHDLRLLSIGYFIQGGIVITYGLLALCYVGFMGAIFGSIPNSPQGDPRNQIPAGLLYAIGSIVIAVSLVTLVGGSCALYAGLALRKHKKRTFVLVMAALNCLAVPYGTVLGIFTFLVLQRTEAKEIFGQTPAPTPQVPQTL
jgi:hypothetical protein